MDRPTERLDPRAAEALRLVDALTKEFSQSEAPAPFVELESVYARYLGIAGHPLIDGYNFGQTVINDFGRPVAGGANFIGGFSAAASAGRWSLYARAEYQHSPGFFSSARELKSIAGQLEPVIPDSSNGIDRFRPLEMYAGVQIGAWSLTVGKQGLWWGPGESGPLSFSNNAEPFYSFRLTHPSPIFLPGFLRRLGGFRLDVVGGRLEGHLIPPRPLLNGQRITWNPLKNLEVGFTRWSLFGGDGVGGLTFRSVARNLFANGPTFGRAGDPGDRKSGCDFRWRLPFAGRFVTLYSDFYADDEPSPLA
ncbi:MAG TPA: capsule assembly Wzi family protein, partial [Bryobacteraceae bacterium]|nr:capsule assembly Wzi family protein [Bryobacteraceae bacterium]